MTSQTTLPKERKSCLISEVMASAYKKYVAPNNPPSAQATHKGDKGKGGNKGMRMPEKHSFKGKSFILYPAPEEVNHDLLMLPHPAIVNRDEETYVVLGHNVQVRVTKENWNTLRFNTKSLNAEYFPSSYLPPVPTVLSETGDAHSHVPPSPELRKTSGHYSLLLFSPRTPRSPRFTMG
jgi:hypothetical protein